MSVKTYSTFCPWCEDFTWHSSDSDTCDVCGYNYSNGIRRLGVVAGDEEHWTLYIGPPPGTRFSPEVERFIITFLQRPYTQVWRGKRWIAVDYPPPQAWQFIADTINTRVRAPGAIQPDDRAPWLWAEGEKYLRDWTQGKL
jgi:hypothetical protein